MKEILFYKMPSGKSPIDDFLDSLSSKEAKKVVGSEIDLAQQRRKDYLSRKDNHE